MGRIFFTWFNPGPGTGLCFAIGGTMAAILFSGFVVGALWLFGSFAGRPFRGPMFQLDQCLVASILVVSYLIIFLGLGKLVIALLRRYTRMNFFVVFGVHLILVAVCTVAPMVIQMTFAGWEDQQYTLLQISNPFWTLAEVLDSGLPAGTPVLVTIVPAMALLVMLANWPSIAAELRKVRVIAPKRVTEDDIEMAPVPVPVKTSPWD
jgi:hypothetical protein